MPPFAFSEDYHRCMVRRLYVTRVRSIVQILLELAVCCVDVESRAKNSTTNIKTFLRQGSLLTAPHATQQDGRSEQNRPKKVT